MGWFVLKCAITIMMKSVLCERNNSIYGAVKMSYIWNSISLYIKRQISYKQIDTSYKDMLNIGTWIEIKVIS